MFLRWSSFKVVQRTIIPCRTAAASEKGNNSKTLKIFLSKSTDGGSCFSYMYIYCENLKKNPCPKVLARFENYFGTNVPWVTLYKDCSTYFDLL